MINNTSAMPPSLDAAQKPTRISMNFGLELRLVIRFLSSTKRRYLPSLFALFSFLGIIFGVAAIIVVMSVINGFRAEILDKLLGINGHLILTASTDKVRDYEALANRIEAVDGVRAAIPLIAAGALAVGNNRNVRAAVWGIEPSDLEKLSAVSSNISEGSIDALNTPGRIAIGNKLAQQLRVKVDDTIKLITPNGPSTPFGTVPSVKKLTVGMVFEIGMHEFDSSFIYMSLPEAQRLLGKDQSVDNVTIYVDDADEIGRLTPLIADQLDGTFFANDWRERNKSFFTALQVERNVMFLILSLIILVAALNIVSGLVMLVKDKARGIAILRTMGAQRGSIMRVFIMCGIVLGLVGSIGGMALGLAIVFNIDAIKDGFALLLQVEIFSPEHYFLSKLPAKVVPEEVLSVVAMAFVIAVISAIIPSWKAAGLDPVEALK